VYLIDKPGAAQVFYRGNDRTAAQQPAEIAWESGTTFWRTFGGRVNMNLRGGQALGLTALAHVFSFARQQRLGDASAGARRIRRKNSR